jgi:serine/threonine-protein kinase HipA
MTKELSKARGMSDELVALLDGYEVGRLRRGRGGKMSFVYNDDWRKDFNAYPISLSMPLALKEHGHKTIDAFLWGLLPDNQKILDTWARRFQVPSGSAFKLIASVGEDCAGAIQFVVPDRLDEVRSGTQGEVAWLSEHEIADRLKTLLVDHAAWRSENDVGQFSLAGAQPKTAFILDSGNWGIPSGRIPTTHILKPPLADYDGHAENEHFCLTLAGKFGLLVTESRVMRFEDQIAIVVTRYDRMRRDGQLRRVHQEDLCQAIGLPPSLKYQAEGGPSAHHILHLIDAHSVSPLEDRATFVKALAINWLIGGTDGHAKNYSFLMGSGGGVRLAPLYDLASALPYDTINQQKATLAMSIGGKYRINEIRSREWRKFASEENLNSEEMFATLRSFAATMPDYVLDTRQRLESEGLNHGLLDRLKKRLIARARHCDEILETTQTRHLL